VPNLVNKIILQVAAPLYRTVPNLVKCKILV
jgi:hypothetical protein